MTAFNAYIQINILLSVFREPYESSVCYVFKNPEKLHDSIKLGNFN